MSRDPIGERGGLNLYGFVRNDPISLVDSDGRSIAGVIITAAAGGGLVIGPIYEFLFAPYSDEEWNRGSRLIYIKKDCTIVVLIAHGVAIEPRLSADERADILASKPGVHLADDKVEPSVFFFEKRCQAGGAVSCFAASTNTRIPERNRIGGLNLDMAKNVTLAAYASLYPIDQPWWKASYWIDAAKTGAEDKAREICRQRECGCCRKVTIYWEYGGTFGGIGAFVGTLPTRPYRSKEISCSE